MQFLHFVEGNLLTIETRYTKLNSLTRFVAEFFRLCKVSIKYFTNPDFSPYAHLDYAKPVEINMTGKNGTDFRAANKVLVLSGSKSPQGYLWYECGFSYTGGDSIKKIINKENVV